MDLFDDESTSTVREILVHNYLHMFAISCLYYDHLLTSGQEIDFLWRRRKSQSFSDLSPQVCKRYSLFRQLLLIVNQVLVCVLLTLRIYALYGCSPRILAYMVGSGAILVTISCVRHKFVLFVLFLLTLPPQFKWALFAQKSAPSERGSGCHVGLSNGTAIRLAGAWEALFVYDSIIFSLTLFKTWKARRDHAITGIEIPLISMILRDGAIYFAVMALSNFANILTFYFCGPFLRGSLSTFASSISVTMMSRLMLNLHQTADVGLFSTQATSTHVDYTSHYDTSGVMENSGTASHDLESTQPGNRKSL
ncbi:hypothetical protein B0H34DRAFT_486936 [Crassisporium funariophilum]|nr:hypothetical protein B0H34DRAFT_486936 [Crassisporium funariophilum]